MDRRLRGVTYRTLLPRLPRNLLVFDGHCLMSQARVRYVLERNFNYFRMVSYFMGNEADMAEQLDRHRIHFLSLDSSEAEELQRLLLAKKPKTLSGAQEPLAARQGTEHPHNQEVALLFLEKVPSRSATVLLSRRASAAPAPAASTATSTVGRVDALFQNPTTVDDSYASLSGKNVIRKKNPVNLSADTMSTQALRNPEDTDLLVSTNFAALCRVGMHLDRWLVRCAWRVVYWLTPRPLGNWWFDRFVLQRRRTIWGTSEKDAVRTLGVIEGMRERRWSWRTRFPA